MRERDEESVGLKHWRWNPAVAVNELFFGNRIPENQIVCRSCDLPLNERTWIPCEKCGELHSAKLWSHGNAFGNWRGLGCQSCGAPIRCLWNYFSQIILVATIVYWFPPYLWFFHKRPLRRVGNPHEVTTTPKTFITMGLVFGLWMWTVMTVIMWGLNNYAFAKPTTMIGSALSQLPVWFGGGVVFGVLMCALTARPKAPAVSQKA